VLGRSSTPERFAGVNWAATNGWRTRSTLFDLRTIKAKKGENMKHTPGPWTVGETRHYKHSGGVDGTEVAVHYGPAGNRGNCIAFAHGHGASGDAEADARLIAAAPDLLEQLSRIVAMIDPEGRDVNFDHARDAIAKATGEAA
jgi:hypothetical protein